MISELDKLFGFSYACVNCNERYSDDDELIGGIICPHCGHAAKFVNYSDGVKENILPRLTLEIYEFKNIIKKVVELLNEYNNAESIGNSYYLLFKNDLFSATRYVSLDQLRVVKKEVMDLSQRDDCTLILKKTLSDFANMIKEFEDSFEIIQNYIDLHQGQNTPNVSGKMDVIQKLQSFLQDGQDFIKMIKSIILKISSLYV